MDHDSGSISSELLHEFMERMQARHPDFKSFDEPGETFGPEELIEKQKILAKFEAAGGRQEIERLVAQRNGVKAVAILESCQRVRLALVNHYGWKKMFRDDKRAANRIMRVFLETCDRPSMSGFDKICRTIRGGGGSCALDLISSIYWMLNPEEFYPFAASYIKSLAQEMRFDFPTRNDPPAKLMAAVAMGHIFRDALTRLHPKNWIEVQSFMWCAAQSNRYIRNEDHEPEEEPEEEDMEVEESFDPANRRFWVLAAGAKGVEWGDFLQSSVAAIGWDELGDLSEFESQDAIAKQLDEVYPNGKYQKNNSLACWEFADAIKPGDIIFIKAGLTRILGYGLVLGDYRFDESRERYQHVRKVRWISNTQASLPPGNVPRKALTEVTGRESLAAIKLAANYTEPEDDGDEEETLPPEDYTVEQALLEVFLSREELESILDDLREKKNVILQGAPGVGKTFLAKRLAYTLVGSKRRDRTTSVQFHQSYSYEDFIQGFRPNEEGNFALKNGPFLRFCEEALLHQSEPFVFVIDEINRGNLSKIFGELMLLIEPDKRDKDSAIPLLYNEAVFFVPPNVHIIGLMNTADRSLALVDYALRRRFRFHTLDPKFDSIRFAETLEEAGADSALIERIRRAMAGLNAAIRDEPGLGRGYCIGHSYFCPQEGQVCDSAWYQRVVKGDIVPLIEEYWFDNPGRVKELTSSLLG